jgi:hypothetical protein
MQSGGSSDQELTGIIFAECRMNIASSEISRSGWLQLEKSLEGRLLNAWDFWKLETMKLEHLQFLDFYPRILSPSCASFGCRIAMMTKTSKIRRG